MQGKIIFVSLFPIVKPYFVSMVYVYFCLSFQKKSHMILAAPVLAQFMTLKGQLCVLLLRMMLTADLRFFYQLFLNS